MPAAPIAWNGLVFIGNGGGDLKNVNGRRTRVYPVDSTRLPQVADVKETDAALRRTKRPTSSMARVMQDRKRIADSRILPPFFS